MFDLQTLTHFLSIARHQNLSLAADELNVTPSALSKSLKRLEQELQTLLFERAGRQLKLNADGERLAVRAGALMAQADQLQSEFLGARHAFRCRLAGPALLHLHWGCPLVQRLTARYPQALMAFGNEPEDEAVQRVLRGDADLALVTGAVRPHIHPSLGVLDIGQIEFQIAIGNGHPLAGAAADKVWRASLAEVLQHDFVLPVRPAFSGLEQYGSSDGWRDDLLPRKIRFRSDDMLIVDGLVRAGLALAYLPDYLIPELMLRRLDVPDYAGQLRQNVLLVHHPAKASGWLRYLIDGIVLPSPGEAGSVPAPDA